MHIILSILSFVFVMGLIVFIHELGHFIAAKKYGVYCSEFAIGMGPIIFSKQGKETKYTLRLLPIGGFVAMAGEDESIDVENLSVERTLNGIKTGQKIIVMLAGIFMNVVLAFVIYLGVFIYQGQARIDGPLQIETVQSNSVAAKNGFMPNDEVKTIIFKDKKYTVKNVNDTLTAMIIDRPEKFVVIRNNEEITLTNHSQNEEIAIDGAIIAPKTKKIQLWETPLFAIKKIGDDSTTIFKTLSGLIRGKGVKHISGPVGIFNVVGSVAQRGVLPLFVLIALLSINIGLFNLLPIPALDGGRVLLTIAEAILKDKYNKKLEHILITGSFILLILLILLITANDIYKLF